MPVRVKGKDQEKEIEMQALLDDGCDVSLCTGSLVQQLGLPGMPKQFALTTVNGKSHAPASGGTKDSRKMCRLLEMKCAPM